MSIGRDRSASESGSVSLEMVLGAPLLLLLVALLLQLGVLYHADNVVTAAAQAGVQEARSETGTAGEGNSAAMRFIEVAAPDFIRKPSAKTEVKEEDKTVTVEVAGDAFAIVPGLKLHVTARATAPLERFDTRD